MIKIIQTAYIKSTFPYLYIKVYKMDGSKNISHKINILNDEILSLLKSKCRKLKL